MHNYIRMKFLQMSCAKKEKKEANKEGRKKGNEGRKGEREEHYKLLTLLG